MAERQIKLSKGNESYDSERRHVFAEKIQPLPEDLKKKISIILEAVPTRSKNEIAEVLQSCDYDVDKALNRFVAGEEMEIQNEWTVQGKRKNKKKKKSGKKTPKDNAENQVDETPQTINSKKDPPSDVQETKESEKETTESKTHRPSNLCELTANGKLPQGNSEKLTTIEKDGAQKNPGEPLEDGELGSERTKVSETLSPISPLSPTESLKSSPDSQTFTKDKPSGTNARVRTQSTSGPEVIRKSLKDLQRSSVSISRFQSMLDAEAESSTKLLTKTFQMLRQALDEREKVLDKQLEDVTLETRNLLQERQLDTVVLKFKCNRVGTMTEHEITELRNEIKHFVGERRIDEDLGKTKRFLRDEEKMMEAINNFGEVPPVKHHYTAYKRKLPEPAKPGPSKTAPPKTTSSSTLPAPSSDVQPRSKHEAPSETKASNSRNNKHAVLSPSRLKDQAEMHARLQEALKHQGGSGTKDGKREDRATDIEKPKPKDHGSITAKSQNGQQPAKEPHRQQVTQHHRQANSRNSTRDSTRDSSKSPNKHDGSKYEGENKKPPPLDECPADGGVSSPRAEDAQPTGNNNKEGTAADHVNNYPPGNKRTKRRYIRKTPLDKSTGGANNFKNRNVPPDKNAKHERSSPEGSGDKQGSTQGSGDKQGSTQGSGDKQSSTQGAGAGIKQRGADENAVVNGNQRGTGGNAVVNGVNGVAPLPQRKQRGRKVYYKKDPESEIKFPPPRENGSLSNDSEVK